jgi:hypothetical protein
LRLKNNIWAIIRKNNFWRAVRAYKTNALLTPACFFGDQPKNKKPYSWLFQAIL